MRKNEIVIIVILLLVLVGAVIFFMGSKDDVVDNEQVDTEVEGTTTPDMSVTDSEPVAEIEEYVDVQADGTKVNTSSKIQETKTIDGLSVSNVSITESGSTTTVTATVTNNTSSTNGDFTIFFKILDDSGNVLAELFGIIGSVDAGASTTLSLISTGDLANAYDYQIVKAN